MKNHSVVNASILNFLVLTESGTVLLKKFVWWLLSEIVFLSLKGLSYEIDLEVVDEI